MAYKYPDGAKTVDGIVTDIIATTAWVDLIIGLRLAHVAFPVNMTDAVGTNQNIERKFLSYHKDIIEKMTYRQKVDMLFALVDINSDEQYRKDIKTLCIALGEIRNKTAHNMAISLIPDDFDLAKESVGSDLINTNYKAYNLAFKGVKGFIEELERGMGGTSMAERQEELRELNNDNIQNEEQKR